MIIDSLSVVLGMDTKNFDRGMIQSQSKLKKWNKGLSTLSDSVTNFGSKLATRVSLPLAGIAGMATAKLMQFDKAMTESVAIMGDVTDDQRKKMDALAKDLSTKYAYGPSKLAESYYFLASAGMDATDSMKALPVVTQFAQAGAFDMALATDLLTDSYSALGDKVKTTGNTMKDMTHLGDLLVGANTIANASVQQFAEAISTDAGATIKNYNLDLNNSIGVLAAYADQSIKGAHAGNMFGRMVRLLAKAYGGHKEKFKEMGIAVYDQQGNFREWHKILADMEKAFAGMSSEQKSAQLETLGFSALTQKAILPLIGASDKIAEYTEKLDKMGGKMQEVSDKQLESFSNRLSRIKNRLEVVGISIGEKLMPIVEKMMEKLEQFSEWWGNLDDAQREQIVTIGLWVAAAGPLLMVFGSIGKGITNIITLGQKLQALELGTWMANLSGTSGMLVKALGAVGAGFAGWQLGRFIESKTGIGEKMWSNLMGYKQGYDTTEMNKARDLRAQREAMEKKNNKILPAKKTIAEKEENTITGLSNKYQQLDATLKSITDKAMAEDGEKKLKKKKDIFEKDEKDISNEALILGSVEEYKERMRLSKNQDDPKAIQKEQLKEQKEANKLLKQLNAAFGDVLGDFQIAPIGVGAGGLL